MTTFLILGASRGLGEAFAIGLPKPGDIVYLVSRTKPEYITPNQNVIYHWIQSDLSSPNSNEIIASSVKDLPIDVCIQNAGIWETDSFDQTPDSLIKKIIDTNLTSALLIIKKVLPNIARSGKRKIILIGSTSGMENSGCSEIAYTASKFGLRGAAQALRELCRPNKIGVTCINPGSIATDVSLSKGTQAAIDLYKGTRIPIQDLCSLVECVINLSPASCVKEIDMPALSDVDV